MRRSPFDSARLKSFGFTQGKRALNGLDQDIQDHIERETQDGIERGLSPEEARRQAILTFGNIALVKEDTRAVWVWVWLEQLLQDVRYALRVLRRNPSFASVVIATLGLGTGANTAIFSLMDQVLLRTLPVPQPGDLVLLDAPGVYQGRTAGSQVFSVPMFRGLQAASAPVLSGMFSRFNTPATINVDQDAEGAFVELVSGDYFGTLGVGALIGRTLGPEDDRTVGGHPVVVLSHGYWQRRFGGDARVVNRAIRVNGHPMTIVGIVGPEFTGVDLGGTADLFVPLMMKRELTPTWNDLDSWRSRWVHVMGRLRPGVSREQAAAALNVSYRQLLHEDIETARLSAAERAMFLEKSLLVHPGGRGRSTLRNQFSTPLIVLMGMVALVLLIACVNVANLLLARAVAQQKDVAIRLALGAGRLRVVRQRLTESLVLAVSGALVGLLFARWTTSLLIEMLPNDRATRALSSDLDSRVVLFAIGIATATALLFGLAPALQATKPLLTSALKERMGSGGARHTSVRKGLVVAQVALSVLLLTGAGLFARSLYNLRSVNPGFATDNLLQFSVNAALSGYTRERALTLFGMLQEQLSRLPGVASASLAVVPAMADSIGRQTVRVQGYAAAEGEDMSPSINTVGPDYFATMGMPLVMGREFRPGDRDGAPKVAVINETMASYFWRGQDPIGRRFGRDGSGTDDEFEVVGVVRDAKFISIRDEIPRFFYQPYMQRDALNTMTFYVRHRPGIEGLSSAARQVVERLDPHLPILSMKTMEAQVDESLFLERLVASLSVLFGALAMVLAAVGLYGVVSYAVSRRTREIGIRMALGAARVSVLWMVLREAIVLVVAGVLLGLPVALGLSRLVESQLFGLSSTDPMTLGIAAILLSVVATVAAYLPARRATRVDPMLALRYE